jgi:hypothetical protein
MRRLTVLVGTLALVVLAGCPGRSGSEHGGAPRPSLSGVASAAPHAVAPGRAKLGAARAATRKPPPPDEAEEEPPLLPPEEDDAGAADPGPTPL